MHIQVFPVVFSAKPFHAKGPDSDLRNACFLKYHVCEDGDQKITGLECCENEVFLVLGGGVIWRNKSVMASVAMMLPGMAQFQICVHCSSAEVKRGGQKKGRPENVMTESSSCPRYFFKSPTLHPQAAPLYSLPCWPFAARHLSV